MRACVGYCDYRLHDHDRDRICISIKKDSSTEHGLGAGVVKTLTSDFKGKYHHVYFDNFLTSHLIPLNAWHPMQPLTNMFTINYNWVSGDRVVQKKSATQQHNNATITSTHNHIQTAT